MSSRITAKAKVPEHADAIQSRRPSQLQNTDSRRSIEAILSNIHSSGGEMKTIHFRKKRKVIACFGRGGGWA
ncbi:hypothetical protein PX699_29090 [Sphingobium sp. H39-3-25]|uniref:hypothetical protein n=1 Tax=Sphingobium arseniciresistens TaxID=3030834 RepID=UPI0023B91204|nr:hypothetical protein [Sphingobium arseniciresistens]